MYQQSVRGPVLKRVMSGTEMRACCCQGSTRVVRMRLAEQVPYLLRACYAVPGTYTIVAIGCTAMSSTEVYCWSCWPTRLQYHVQYCVRGRQSFARAVTICLRAWYAMSSTELAYGATRERCFAIRWLTIRCPNPPSQPEMNTESPHH